MRKHATALSALILSTLSGCALYQAPEGAPTLPLVNEFTHTESATAFQAKDGVWWRGFEDAALNEVVETALAHNTDIRIALANVNAARALRGLQRWEYLPTGGVGVSLDRGRVEQGEGTVERFNVAGATLGANWELDLFGRVLNGNRIADANRLSVEADLDAARLLVVSEAAATYFRIRASERKIASRANALAQQQRIVEITRAMVEEARVAPDALERALAEQANDEASLLREREERRTLQNRMAVLLGKQPGRWRLAEQDEQRAIAFRPADLGDVDSLLRNRPDVRSAAQRLIARQASVKAAQSAYFPTVSVTGAVGFVAGGFGDLGDSNTETWSVAPSLSWNVLDFGRTAKRVDANKAQVEGALAAYERTALIAIEETENALARLGASQSELSMRERAHRHSLAATAAANARYEEGMGTYLEALYARRDSVAADLARIDSIADQRLATIELFTVLGIAP
jgi:NodT family efflux transporter outer membrane factor (OMF) lipoprotein